MCVAFMIFLFGYYLGLCREICQQFRETSS